jgi:hypothetical protein
VARRLRTIQIIESLQGPTGDLSVPVYQALTQRAQKAVDDGRVDRAIDLWGELAWYHDKYDPYLKHA